MLSRRTAVIRLCQRFANITHHGKLPPTRSCLYNCDALAVSTKSFSTFTQRYKDMKIVTDKFDEDKFFAENNSFDAEYGSGSKSRAFSFDENEDFFHEERPKKYRNPKNFDFEDESYSESEVSRRGSNKFGRYDDYSHRSPRIKPNPQYRQPRRFSNDRYADEHETDYDDDSSYSRKFNKDSISRASYLRGRHQEHFETRKSMEDLWNQVKNSKVKFSETESIEKNLYAEHTDVTNRTEEEIKKFMDLHQMTVTGNNAKRPIFHFEETGFPDEIINALRSSDFSQPTPIQSIGWPHALSGCDIVGIAQTGSGKTLSFLIPAMLHIQQRRRTSNTDGPFALVLCPTRELALQCHSVIKKFGKFCRTKSAIVYGGTSKLHQADRLSEPGLDIVIATPGRLLDFISTDVVSLEKCSFVVLDEADRMLDMGFEPQIRAVMSQIRPDRQVLMWSATWPEEIRELASDFLKDYVHVKIGTQMHTVNADITQEFQYCDSREKLDLLIDHLTQNRNPENPRKPAKTLLFCATKNQCSRLHGILKRENIYADVIHGDKSQLQRDRAMQNFRAGRTSVLIASDVAARGIDVNDIEYVVNYDLPNNIDSYIHRIGRTGRAGRKGTSISYITATDLDMVKPIINILSDVDHDIPDVLHGLLGKREKLKSYRKISRQRDNHRNSWSSSKKHFRF